MLEISTTNRGGGKLTPDPQARAVAASQSLTCPRRHFTEDMLPYVCLSNCKPQNMFFSRLQDWLDHMTLVHGHDWIQGLQRREAWYCDVDHCPSSRQRFTNAGELQAHIEWTHRANVTTVRLFSMMKRNVVISYGSSRLCPICFKDVLLESQATPNIPRVEEAGDFLIPDTDQDLDDPAEQEIGVYSSPPPTEDVPPIEADVAEAVAKHIATHLKSLVFLSLKFTDGRNTPAHARDHQSEVSSKEDDPTCSVGYVARAESAKQDLEPWTSDESHSGRFEPSEVHQSPASLPEQTKLLTSTSTSSSQYSNEARGLGELMYDCLVESTFDGGHFFLPAGTFQTLFTEGNIRRELQAQAGVSHGPGTASLVKYACTDAKILFAILLYIGFDLPAALAGFLKHKLTDRHLPLPRDVAKCARAGGKGPQRECNHDPAFNAFHDKWWRRVGIFRFYEVQWMFLAPVFTPTKRDLKLDSRAILPISQVKTGTRMGLFSNVHEVVIHPDHCREIIPDADRPNSRVALKELRVDSQDSTLKAILEQEILAAATLRSIEHSHMVNSIATVNQGERRFLLFPWADGGNLRDFWMASDIRPLTPALILEVLKQLLGMSNALHNLHGHNIRHGDLKPENILRFRDGTTIGTLKLGDMGLAKLHSESTSFRNSKTQTRIGTMRYEAPEVVVSSNQPRSRRYDIWSMGCIILEFAIWLQYGPGGLRDFNYTMHNYGTGGAFYTIISEFGWQSAKVHPTVQLWLNRLCNDANWTQYTSLGDLVRLVQTDLLVVDISPDASTPELETSLLGLETGPLAPSLLVSGPAVPVSGLTRSASSHISRADAGILEMQLERIFRRSLSHPRYLFPEGAERLDVRVLRHFRADESSACSLAFLPRAD